ncbi:hypothetical protein TWF694_006221 [Orbilia ellipsospora]|uniref:Uncharacterized protein n=1 Tax=Orbilia ellipsospora TaxID=2528407 RepID=A0AAV9XKX9_9PEZI
MNSLTSPDRPTRCSVDDVSFPPIPSHMFYKQHPCEYDLKPNSHQTTAALRSAVYVAEIKLQTYREHIIGLDQKIENLERSLAEISTTARASDERRQRLIEKLRAAVLRNQELIQQIEASREKSDVLEQKVDDLLETNAQSYRTIQEYRREAAYFQSEEAKAKRAKAQRDSQLLKDLDERIGAAENALAIQKSVDDVLKVAADLGHTKLAKAGEDSDYTIVQNPPIRAYTANHPQVSAPTHTRSSSKVNVNVVEKWNYENDGLDDSDDGIEISIE